MEQIFLKVKLPSGKTCLITNTGVNYVRVWEEDLVTIGVTDPDIYTDTKRQLGAPTATPPSRQQLASLERLKTFLEGQIVQDPASRDSVGFSQMVRAICELIAGGQ
jgi:hypothetical protein